MALALGSSLASKIYLGATEVTLAYLGATQVYTSSAFSTEAQNYFDRLDTAGDTTYTTYKQPLANYIDSLVSLGGAYWDTMLSSTSFVGVGIQGVTVPLRDGMTVATNNNFVAGDLNQLTGLKGNASSKYINTGVNATDLSQNDTSISVYVTTPAITDNKYYAGAFSGADILSLWGPATSSRIDIFSTSPFTAGAKTTGGLYGGTRTGAAAQEMRVNQTNYPSSKASTAPVSAALSVFATSGIAHTDARFATYHAGPALNLATLEGLQATLISEIAAI